MTIRHFRIFLNVCQTLNMTRSAEQLCMTQPSISQAIAELESHYHCKLFERVGKKLQLTIQGGELSARSASILDLLESTKHYFQNSAKRRTIRLGCSATVGSFLLPTLIAMKQRERPELQIDFRVGNTTEIEAALLRGEIDLAFVEGRIHSVSLKSHVVIKDELALVGSPSLIPKGKSSSIKDIEKMPFLMREKGSGTAELMEDTLSEWKIAPHICGVVNSIDALLRLVRCGAGITFLPRLAVAKDLEEGLLTEVHLSKKRIVRHFKLVYPKARQFEGDLAWFKGKILALSINKAD